MTEEQMVEVNFTYYLPSHAHKLQLHMDAKLMHSILLDIETKCRSEFKHGQNQEVSEFAQEIRNLIWDEIDLYKGD